jgi:hypothetical protein
MPIVSFDVMRQGFFRDANAQYGDIMGTEVTPFQDGGVLMSLRCPLARGISVC